MINSIYDICKKHFSLIIIVLVGLIPAFTWFKGDFLINGGDDWWLLDPTLISKYFLYAWNIKLYNAGSVNPIQEIFPFFLSFDLLHLFNISPLLSQRIWILLLFVLPGISMYYLMSVLECSNIAKIISSIFYMYNIYLLQVGPYQQNIKLLLIVLPPLFAFFIQGLSTKKYLKYSCLFCIATVFCATSTVNPPAVIAILLIFILVIGYLIFVFDYKLKEIFKFSSILIAGTVLINAWWNIFISYYVISSQSSLHSQLTFSALSTHQVYDFFRLIGFWAWDSQMYFPYSSEYNTSFVLILSFLLPVCLFSSLILYKKNKWILFFSGLSLVGIFLAKGTVEPFGLVYNYLFLHFPGFFMFREPFAKFTPLIVFSYSVLLGMSISGIWGKIGQYQISIVKKTGIQVILIICVILVILINAFPLVTGEVIRDSSDGPMRSFYISVPSYWLEISNWSANNPEDTRIFLTPNKGYGIVYNWSNGFNGEAGVVYLDKMTLKARASLSVRTDQMIDYTYGNLKLDNKNNASHILGLLNCRYLLQQNDVDWIWGETYSPDQMKLILNQSNNITKIHSFGNLDLYQIDDSLVVPHIYAATNYIIVNGTTDSLVDYILQNDMSSKIIFLSSDLSSTQQNNLQSVTRKPTETYFSYDKNLQIGQNTLLISNPEDMINSNVGNYNITNYVLNDQTTFTTFEQINPTRYEVTSNATQPFFLVFSESYHPKWKAYVENKPSPMNQIVANYSNVNVQEAAQEMQFTPGDVSYLFAQPLPEDDHFLVNGYANAWYIDPSQLPKDANGNINITLYFWPQSLFYLGLFISGSTLIICIGYLVHDWNRGRRKRKGESMK
jgi:hypothetical protein